MSAYLDCSASTPMRPEAVDAMLPHLRDHWANPSGAHTLARAERKAIDEARDVMASVLGADASEIVFTGGGTESDNLAVLGVHDRVGGTLVASAVEHHAVLDPVLSRKGRLAPVDERGLVDLGALAALLEEIQVGGERVSLVSVMLANNEVGTVQELDRVAKVVRRHAPGALLHTDAVQAVQWLDVATLAASADLVSVSAHKFGGPKGVGALVVRAAAADHLAARTLGGGQERERRSGTQNVAGIVGMATAARLTVDDRAATVERVRVLRNRLADGLLEAVDDTIESGVITADADADGAGPPGGSPRRPDRAHKVAGTCHLCFEGVDSESLLYLLERAEVYASAASSCASGAAEPSHVLAAMGIPRSLAAGSLRLSLGWATTGDEVDAALAAVPPAVERLRLFS
jgi:cysteine desulfurase